MSEDFARLGTCGDTRAIAPLVDALGNPPRETVVEALLEIKPISVEPIIGQLERGAGPACVDATRVLGRLGHECSVELLIRALGDFNSHVRRAAASPKSDFSPDRRGLRPAGSRYGHALPAPV